MCPWITFLRAFLLAFFRVCCKFSAEIGFCWGKRWAWNFNFCPAWAKLAPFDRKFRWLSNGVFKSEICPWITFLRAFLLAFFRVCCKFSAEIGFCWGKRWAWNFRNCPTRTKLAPFGGKFYYLLNGILKPDNCAQITFLRAFLLAVSRICCRNWRLLRKTLGLKYFLLTYMSKSCTGA